MKRPGIISTSVMLLMFGGACTICARAQDEKPPQEEPDKKPPEPSKSPDKKPQENPPAKPNRPVDKPDEKPAKPEQPKSEPAAKPPKQEKQTQTTAKQTQTKASRGATIPDDKYRAHFGENHKFHVGHLTTVSGGQGFAYGGYSFQLVDAWPAGWAYTDEFYIVFIDGNYFLCDPNYPGVQIAIVVVE